MSRHIGEEIGGYRVIEPIGAGGMAKVFKAYQPAFDRFVALKVLPDHYAEDETYIQRFKQEAKIIARLEHRHILPVYDFGEDRGITYLAMRYLRAGTLKDVLRQAGGVLPLADTSRIVGQIAQALDYAHAQGIVHRDVKPSNVLIDSAGDAFLMDFGIAKVLEGTAHLTSTGGAMGTPAYMSPEQGAGRKVDARTDIYSLGVMLYEMVTGRVPFEADTPFAVVLAHANEPLPLPSSIKPDVPEQVERIIFKALAKRPEDRYSTAGRLADDLAQTVALAQPDPAQSAHFLDLAAALAQTKPQDEVTRDVRIAARKKRRKGQGVPLAVLGIGGVVVVVVIAVLLLLLSRATDPQRALEIAGNVTRTAQAVKDAAATQQGLVANATAVLVEKSRLLTATVIALTPTSTPGPLDSARIVNVCGDGSGLCISAFRSGTMTDRLVFPQFHNIYGAAWSPDGKRVAFGACTTAGWQLNQGSGCNNLFAVDVATKELVPILDDGFFSNNSIFPSWSPDGQWLAFHNSGDLAIIHPDGSGFRILALVGNTPRCVQKIAWSPDSQRIAWTGGPCPGNGVDTVMIVNLDGSNLQTLYTKPSGGSLDQTIAFSPDGRSLLVRTSNGITLIDPTCPSEPGGCGDAFMKPYTGSFPIEWFDNFYPQWAGDQVAAGK